MAINLTKTLTSTPSSPLSYTHKPLFSSSLNPNSFHSTFNSKSSLQIRTFKSISGGIKCSMNSNGYYEYEQAVAPKFPKPSEIPWKKELCNSVQLIGIVGTPVQIKHLNSGKVLAWSRLAVKKSATDTAWINLTFWDELAHVAFQHVEKGQQIYVSGRLVSDTIEADDGKQQTYYKVVVQELNFVERSAAPVPLYEGDSNSSAQGRKSKTNSGNSTGTTEELWQAFFANPVDWWDNRKNKRNPNYPDFKHKDTGEALWIEGRGNPNWVKSQLSVLDARMEGFQDQNRDTIQFSPF